MLPPSPSEASQTSFLDILSQLDCAHPLLVPGNTLEWSSLEALLGQYYSPLGRAAKPLRLMSGLLMLKQLYHLSDEAVVSQWRMNPCFQVFCGAVTFQTAAPCHATELAKFRKRIGPSGIREIFSLSVRLHGEASAGRLRGCCCGSWSASCRKRRCGAAQVVCPVSVCAGQQLKDQDKIYSLHEPDIYCVGKGQDHKPWEYGRKASGVSTGDSQVMVGVVSHDENMHDSRTLEDALSAPCGDRADHRSPESELPIDPELAQGKPWRSGQSDDVGLCLEPQKVDHRFLLG